MIRLVRGVALIVGLYLNTHQSAHRLHCSLVSPLLTSRTCCRLQVAVCGCVYCAGPASTAGQAPGQARPRCPAVCHSLLCFPLSPAQHLDTGHWTLHAGQWTRRHQPLSHLSKPQLCLCRPLPGLLTAHSLLLTHSHARPGHYGALRPPRLARGPRHRQLRGRRALRHPRTRAQCEWSLCCRATCHVSRVPRPATWSPAPAPCSATSPRWRCWRARRSSPSSGTGTRTPSR